MIRLKMLALSLLSIAGAVTAQTAPEQTRQTTIEIHADRVKLTAIAQMVNVLQAMILTDGSKMVLTPTYHVFALYRPYMDGTVLPIDIASMWYNKNQWSMPAVSASAVRGKDGLIHIGLANLDPVHPMTIAATVSGITATTVDGQILTAPTVNALNSFAAPDAVAPVTFTGARIDGGQVIVTLPSKSVVMLTLR